MYLIVDMLAIVIKKNHLLKNVDQNSLWESHHISPIPSISILAAPCFRFLVNPVVYKYCA